MCGLFLAGGCRSTGRLPLGSPFAYHHVPIQTVMPLPNAQTMHLNTILNIWMAGHCICSSE